MKERYVLMSGTREFDEVIRGTAAEIASIEDDIKAEMTAQGVSEMLVDVFKVHWTKVLSRRFDTTAFKAKYAELYEQHVKEAETWRFSVA